jgi:acetyl-CoA acetyltransferase
MRTLRRAAAIVGIAELPPRRWTDGETTLGMLAKVARLAAENADVDPASINGLLVGPLVGLSPQHTPAVVAEYLGLSVGYAELVDLGGATATGMVWRAAAAINAGMCDIALCVLANRRERQPDPHWTNRTPIREFEAPYGASGANAAYALIARRHMHDYGTTSTQLAKIAVDMRINALSNPDAIFHGKPLSIDDVLDSPMVADPLHLLDIVMPCAGGAAIVVAARSRKDHAANPVWVVGAGERVTHRALSQAPTLTVSPLASAIASSLSMSGATIEDIDVLSLYDCYTILVAITLEDAGLCRKGQGGPFALDHDLTHRGDVPVNPHGGQLAFGQADLAGGMSHVTEAVRQLRNEAGIRQVRNARLALVTGNGAVMGEGTAMVLEADQ